MNKINCRTQDQTVLTARHLFKEQDTNTTIVYSSTRQTMTMNFGTGEVFLQKKATHYEPYLGKPKLVAKFIDVIDPSSDVTSLPHRTSTQGVWGGRCSISYPSSRSRPVSIDVSDPVRAAFVRRDLGEFQCCEEFLFHTLSAGSCRFVAFECLETCDPNGTFEYCRNVIRECLQKTVRSPSPVCWYEHAMKTLTVYVNTCKTFGCSPDFSDINLHLVSDEFFKKWCSNYFLGKVNQKVEVFPPKELMHVFTELSDKVYEMIRSDFK